MTTALIILIVGLLTKCGFSDADTADITYQEWLGTRELPVNSGLFSSVIINKWEVAYPKAIAPPGLAFHAAFAYSTHLFVFGGIVGAPFASGITFDSNLNPYLVNTTWMFDTGRNVWSLANTSVAPSARAGHAVASSPTSSRALLFGGLTGTGPSNDTWLFDYNATVRWTRVQTPTSPGARFGHAMVLIGGIAVLFGGTGCSAWTDESAWNLCSGDDLLWTFTMATQTWASAAALAGPEPRFGGMATAMNGVMVLVGGCPSPFDPTFNITTVWQLSGIESSSLSWTSVAVQSEQNLGLTSGVLTYYQDRLLIFGGSSYSLTTSLDVAGIRLFPTASPDILSLTNSSWTVLNAQNGVVDLQHPCGSVGHSMTVVNGQLLLYGGLNPFGRTVFTDIWALMPSSMSFVWILIQPETRPSPRFSHTAIRIADQFFVFGGYTPSREAKADLWRFDQPSYSYERVFPLSGALPPPRSAHVAVALQERYMVVYGGVFVSPDGTPIFYDDVWSWDVVQRCWTLLGTGGPIARAKHSAVVLGNGFLTFGGLTNLTYSNETWYFNIATTRWSKLTVSGVGPAARGGHAAAVLGSDSGGLEMYVFGGRDSSHIYGDLWMVSLDGLPSNMGTVLVWHLVPQGIAPLPRFDHCISVLGGNKKMVIFGGASMLNYSNGYSDTWSFVSSTRRWTSLNLPDRGVPVFDCACVFENNSSAGFYLIEGRTTMTDRSMDFLQYVQLGCNAGSYATNFLVEECAACPEGYFSSDASDGMSGDLGCPSRCPGQTSTPGPGPWSSAVNCTTCVPEACNGHGTCLVQGVEVTCDCDFWYRLSPSCSEPVGIIIFVSTVGGSLLIVAIFFVWKYFGSALGKVRVRAELNEYLLESTQKDLETLTEIWHIKPSDVTLGQILDAGAYGEVWLAEWGAMKVAVKKLKESAMELDAECVDDFQKEITLLRSLRSRNIVLFYGMGQFDDGPFFVLEYMSRGSVRHILDVCHAQLEGFHRLRFALDAAQGMAFLHSLHPPMLHRDLKSANLLVNDSWVVKVSDFGKSRYQGASVHTKPGVPMSRGSGSRGMTMGVGTLLWTSPEVCLPLCEVCSLVQVLQSSTYGPPSDVYSFAIIMWEIVTGLLPYEEIDTLDIEGNVIRGVRPTLTFHFNSFPAYSGLMQRSWSADEQLRPTFAAIVKELQTMSLALPPRPWPTINTALTSVA